MENILIVEDHSEARETMQRIVEEAFASPNVHLASTLAQARALLAQEDFDLSVLDLGLPDGKGEDFITELLSAQPNTYVVVSTIHDESERLLNALENGAKGYLLKEQAQEFLVSEFKGISKGKPPLAPAVTRRLLEHIRKNAETGPDASNQSATSRQNPELKDDAEAVASLTEREKEIFVLMAKGFNKPEIAGFLNISKHTVATHVSKIYSRLNIANRSEATLIASNLKLV